jgi:hypothetical protein
VSPVQPIPDGTAVVDDWKYPPAPPLGTADSETPDRAFFYAQGVHFELFAIYGQHATGDDIQAADALATSISVDPAPAPPPVGTAVGRFPLEPDAFAWRIGPPDRFPPDSVVTLSVEPTPAAGQPRSLFIVTPAHPVNEYERWMTTTWDAPCQDLSWDGRVFRCGSRTWKATGEPTDHGHRWLVTSTVTTTWDGQLTTAYNGAAGFP